MRKELLKICVPFVIAKLAYEKGFKELCVFGVNEEEHFPIVDSDEEFLFEYFEKQDDIEVYYCPTHLQLIDWLNKTHDIQVSLKVNGLWRVIAPSGYTLFKEHITEFEVNDAIFLALNSI